jgi:acyl-CoA synthetase (AMP-forming)/AMP-acid ligase II
MKVAIIGLGYVGLPLSLQFARAGVEVIGLDIDSKKVDSLNQGQSYIKHISSDAIKEQRAGNRFVASTDFSLVKEVEAVIICVPTPLNKNREPDISYITETGRAIAPYLTPDLRSPTSLSSIPSSVTLVKEEALAKEDCSVPTSDSRLLTPDSCPLVTGSSMRPSDLAALMFTSGSTGTPKGVMVTHRNIECNTLDIISYMEMTSCDRVMVVLPFYYCFGMSLLHTLLMVGGTVVLNNQFMYPETVLQEMISRACTGLAGVPSTYQILIRKSRFREMAFRSLRWFQQAGGKLPNSIIAELIASFPHVRFYVMYGQTEATARLSFLPPERLGEKLGSIGCGLPSTRLEVINKNGSPVAPGSDEIGEIVAAGNNITLGYWNDSKETGKYFRNGKLYTGDLARVDADGFIFIVDRERDMIKSGGNRVSCKEVEDVIAELDAVVEVAVVGCPHELLGEAIRAFVATRDLSLSAEDVKAHCFKRLPSVKVPESVIMLEKMPHLGSGKIDKPKLETMTLNIYR